MLDHVTLNVDDFARSKAFYEHALAPLGLHVVFGSDEHGYCGFGDERPFFWISRRDPLGGSTHVAFAAPDHATVDAFYAAAIAAGGADNGPPGLRPQYHPDYYGAFVHDPDGNNVEVVCRQPE
jgi:catechol 2,3-dioxygenase-like lactoylglutathione lyase family enzyme